jgi:glycosyltransferase involved in cell wall biosynthesis
MQTTPKQVSAYLPCYNERSSVRAAAESVLNQVTPADEVFIVDDGSTDGSGNVEGIRVVRLEINQGRGAARARACAWSLRSQAQ